MKPIIITTESYAYLGQEMIRDENFELGQVEIKTFPDGEKYHRLQNDLEGRDVILVGGTIDDSSTLELYDLACAAVQYGAQSLTLVVPYFGYSTMERAVRPGELVKARSRALLLSSAPRAVRGNRLLLVDLHTEGLPYYFGPEIRPIHVYAKKIIMEAAKELGGTNFVLAATDAGRAKWVESLANDLGVPAAFVYKERISGSETKVSGINADVRDKQVIIYDDMIRTGGSIVGATKAYHDAGAAGVSVITTHGLFAGSGLEKLRNSGLIRCVVATNTHPNAVLLQDDFLTVKSIAPVLNTALQNLNRW
jgi:ribose-phosphate pyrophosphokinase